MCPAMKAHLYMSMNKQLKLSVKTHPECTQDPSVYYTLEYWLSEWFVANQGLYSPFLTLL